MVKKKLHAFHSIQWIKEKIGLSTKTKKWRWEGRYRKARGWWMRRGTCDRKGAETEESEASGEAKI